MSGTGNSVESLIGQTQSSLSLSSSAENSNADVPSPLTTSSPTNSNGSSTTSSLSSASLSPTSPSSSRHFHGIGSGSGGPPTRPNNIGTGGPSFRGGPASGGPPSANNMATGGPGSRMRANEMTKQLASTKLPPGLQARLAAVSLHIVAKKKKKNDKISLHPFISLIECKQSQLEQLIPWKSFTCVANSSY